jgi:NAD-dependent dihydropyrimidine dehydrogenase PreA subunit
MSGLDGVFIDVDVDESIASDVELARKLEEVCPVDIFAAANGRVEVVRGNLDECVLCELCLDASPPGTVAVRKLYDGTELRGSSRRPPPGDGAASLPAL